MRITTYNLVSPIAGVNVTLAVVADLHDHRYHRLLPLLQDIRPDAIMIPGDLTESLEHEPGQEARPGLYLLAEAGKIAPVFYSFGNHEIGACHRNVRHAASLPSDRVPIHPAYREMIRKSGAFLLDENWITWRGLTIGGLGSGLLRPGRVPAYGWIENFVRQPGYKILLCHQPEYFDRYLRPYDIHLFISGHAHGGQWRILGRGVYAPDQHLFPKYTSGLHEGRLVISRGVVNTVRPIPRFFNPCEIVVIRVHG